MSRSIASGSMVSNACASRLGGAEEPVNPPAQQLTLDEQARQFSALMSGATSARPDVEGPEAREPAAGARASCEEGLTSPVPPTSPQDPTSLEDPISPRELPSLKGSILAKGLSLSKDLPASKDLLLSPDLKSARLVLDAMGHRNDSPAMAVDPDDIRTRRSVSVASFLTPSSPTVPVSLPQTPPPSAAPDLTFAELVQQHVRRTLALEGTNGEGEDEVRLELSDAVLPGTTLSLRRTYAGWQLLAATDNRKSRDKLSRLGSALIARFAKASLGPLEIVTSDSEGA